MQPVPSRLHITIPRRFDPTRSLLGRLVARRFADRRVAESMYFVVLLGVVIAVVLAQFVAWAWWNVAPDLTGMPSMELLWLFELAAVLMVAGFGFVGFAPQTTIEVAEVIRIKRAGEQLTLRHAAVTVSVITRDMFYRHYNRYARTSAFVRALREDQMVLVERPDAGPVVLELDEESRHTFLSAHAARRLATREQFGPIRHAPQTADTLAVAS